jgi:Sulfotransferase family
MLKNLFAGKKEPRPRKVIVVSGLPRSGTSMMMKMLAEGGLSAVEDSLREADEDNPNGYFELESSKDLKTGDKRWLFDAPGKVVKIISYLLEFLPDELTYDIIFMEREIGEVLASQQKMLLRRKEASPRSDLEMESYFREHLQAVKYWLARKPNMRVLYVSYRKLVADPDALCRTIADFLEISLDLTAMKSVPSQSLYRNRSSVE